MADVSQAQGIITALPYVMQFIVGVGGLAVAVMAISNLWKNFRPNYQAEINTVKKELDTKFTDEIDTLSSQIEKLSDRMTKLEKEIAAIDVQQINSRFDRMEKKIDDLLNLMIKSFTKQ